MIIDSHGHPQFRGYGAETEAMMERTKEKQTVVNAVGTEKSTSKDAVMFADRFDFCFATVGLHPGHLFSDHHDENESEQKIEENDFDSDYYEELVKHPKVIAVGECGIDLYRLPENIERATVLKKQTEVFLAQAKLAKKYSLPLVIHCRDAHKEMIDVLKTLPGQTGTIHCYTSNWEFAEQYLDLGYYIGFTGIITFPPQKKNPKAQEDLLEVVRRIPTDRFLVETDCPYLSPLPYRGKQGEPWMVEEVIKKIAEIRQDSVDSILNKSVENAQNLFKKLV
jgi:TatD DNase family protein